MHSNDKKSPSNNQDLYITLFSRGQRSVDVDSYVAQYRPDLGFGRFVENVQDAKSTRISTG